jgi:hypothetical protein
LGRLYEDPSGGPAIPAKPKSGALKGATDGDPVAGVDDAASDAAELERTGHIRVGATPPADGNGTTAVAAPIDEITRSLTERERELLGDLLAVISEHEPDGGEPVDRVSVERAFAFACERHADQRRRSGEEFVSHPVEVAKICAGLRLDT